MTPEDIIQAILSISIWTFLKVFILLALLIYLVFAIVVLRQVEIMTSTFKTGFEIPLKIIAWLHLSLVAFILIVALIFL